jgi:AcrR family transcriptional regulator
MVSRAAFYRNYQDKYGLVEQIFEEAMNALLNAVGEMGPGQHPPEVWVTFFEHIAEYERLYRALLGSRGSSWFVRKMRASLADLVNMHGHRPFRQPEAERSISPFSDDLMPDLMSTMLVEAITWWLEHARPSTPREMATRCALLMSALFKEVSIWH